jgi:cobalamin biosynthesis protein CobW
MSEINIDAELIRDGGANLSRTDETLVELTNGCICCTVADDFIPTMDKLLSRDTALDAIVIETSGLALPQPLVRAFAWPSVRHRVTVDGVVTVVDAAAVAAGRFAPDPQATKAALAADPAIVHDDPIEELFEDQLRCADLIVVSKADLISEGDLAQAEAIVLREARPGIGMMRGHGGGLSPDVLLGLSAASEDDMKGRESHHDLEGEEHDHDDFASFVVRPGSAVSLDAIRARVMTALAVPGVLRIKGRSTVQDRAGAVVVQAVGARVEAYFTPSADAPSLVVIGLRDMDRGAVEAALAG